MTDRVTGHEVESVSVVVPCRDGAAHLGDALDSVCLQGASVAEVVVVDDGSSDDSVAVARAYGATVVPSQGRGPAAARNTGVRTARSPWLAFLDADDVWTPDSLAVRRAAVPQGGVCFGAVARHEEPWASLGPARLPGTMLVSRELWDRVGPLAEARLGGYMLEWVDRLTSLDPPTAVLDDVVLLRRAHADNLSRSPGMQADYLHWARTIVARRRTP